MIDDPLDSFAISSAEITYRIKGVTEKSKHRMSKELAEELRDQMGDNAYLFCVEKLSGRTENPQLWRDVLTWLTETETTKGETK
jgi:hypothetical protein